MPWTYSQNTGRLSHDGVTVGTGYSGHGAGRNNSAQQRVSDIGPIPEGRYAIGAPFHHVHSGGYTMRLTPQAGTITYGRNGFMMHGDSARRPGEASEGCIIQNRNVRQQVWDSGDRTLIVVP